VRRSLIVLGMAAAVLILALFTLLAAGGGGTASENGALSTLATTSTTRPVPTTTTTIVVLKIQGSQKRLVVDLVAVPNVVGMTLGQANQVLSAVGLSAGTWTPTTKPGGESSTGTVLAQAPSPGSQVQSGQVVQLTVSGY
jgi:beta-lactam-binding protein with PASTA domain